MSKNYKVVGSCGLSLPDGQTPRPGDLFAADLPFELEAFLTQIGAVSVEAPAVVAKPISFRPLIEDKE